MTIEPQAKKLRDLGNDDLVIFPSQEDFTLNASIEEHDPLLLSNVLATPSEPITMEILCNPLAIHNE